MAEYYVGEIRMLVTKYAPSDWLLCNGQVLNISEFQALYAVIGTTYSGDGVKTFKLPDLRGRIPLHMDQPTGGSTYPLGQSGGTEYVTVTESQLPAHTHTANCQKDNPTSSAPSGNFWATNLGAGGAGAVNCLTTAAPSALMASTLVLSFGGSQPHDNVMPYQTLSFMIATQGLFPTPN